MINKRIFPDEKNKHFYIDTYVADETEALTRDALLVIPGGGYHEVCSQREGEPIALAFLPHGYNAFVLHYTVAENEDFGGHPSPLVEASLAIAHIRSHAKEYGINPDRIFACGFSAGGHLCATLGTLWHSKYIYDVANIPFGLNKPNGVMLIYPVISAKHHSFSFETLLKDKNPSQEMLDSVSIENCVDENSSPAFILHTSNDQVVNVCNSLELANAYAKLGIEFELHIYPDAPHGVALGNKITAGQTAKWYNPAIAKWVENAVVWADSLK